MTEKLLEEYKIPVEETVQKQLEYQFHSADYHTILQIITGLKTALGHLIKVSAILNFVIYSWAIPQNFNYMFQYATTFGETLIVHAINLQFPQMCVFSTLSHMTVQVQILSYLY